MAKRSIVTQEDDGQVELIKVATVHDRSIINGHVLPARTVTAMTAEDIAKHRIGGVPLDDVEDHDEREVYDTTEPFVSEDNG